jgi:hypothetical protein
MVRTFVSGRVHVHYSQIYVKSGEDQIDLHASFAGQSNGLCGAASPGTLFLTTGLHTGSVGFTVELHEGPPPLDDVWEEVVEASFTPASARVALVQWAGEDSWDLDLTRTCHRVRYCAIGMDATHAAVTWSEDEPEDEPELDRYLLQFWPAAPEPDRIVRWTGENAAYWHRFASNLPPLPPPPPPPTAEELAEAARLRLLEQERHEEERRRAVELRAWGGRLPSERLRGMIGGGSKVATLDRDLAEAIAAAGPRTQRSIARWTARRAYAEAGLADVGWIAPALDALDQGRDLPPPFDDRDQVWTTLFADSRMPRTTVTSIQTGEPDFSQQAMAVPALFVAAQDEPLRAALDALSVATDAFGREGYQVLFAELRRVFGL